MKSRKRRRDVDTYVNDRGLKRQREREPDRRDDREERDRDRDRRDFPAAEMANWNLVIRRSEYRIYEDLQVNEAQVLYNGEVTQSTAVASRWVIEL